MVPRAMPNATHIRLAVVLPHLNQIDALRRCLTALAKGTCQPDEVLVADNGSDTLPPVDLWGLFPNARVLRVAEPGPGPARNAGVAACSANLVAFIDADCVPERDWVEAILTAHRATPDTVLGGDVRIGPEGPTTITACYEAVYAYRADRYIAREAFAAAGNMAVPHTIWEDVGPFGGVHIAEDRDWGQRASAIGFQPRFVPAMRVYHPARPDMSALRTKWDRMLGHDYTRMKGSVGARVRWFAKTMALPLSPLGELPRLILTDRLHGPGQRLRAFVGLCQIRWHRARRMATFALRPDAAAKYTTGWNRA